MKPSWGRTLLGGFLGTVVFSLMMKFVAPRMIGHAMGFSAIARGMIVAFWLFLVAESVVMPMAGNGFWSAPRRRRSGPDRPIQCICNDWRPGCAH